MPGILEAALADVLVAIHAGYLLYLVAGGFVAWIRTAAFWPHLLAALWGVAVVAFSIDCPLTTWENGVRAAAGEGAYRTSFIDHYIAGTVYPEGYTAQAQLVVLALVLISWIPPGARALRRGMRHYGDRSGRTRSAVPGAGGDRPPSRVRFR